MIKSLCVLFLLLSFCKTSQAQLLKKMKANELRDYIANSEKPLVVSFWATWCASCNEELPYFISTIREKYKGNVELLLVSLDIKSYYPEKIQAFAANKKYNTPLVWLNEVNADVFCPLIDPDWSGAIPSTLMVNNKHQYRKFFETGISPAQFDNNLKMLVGTQ